MDHKKKYHGGLKVLLLLLFGMLFVTSSTCYALTPSNQISTYGVQQLFDYFYSVKDNYKVDNWNKMDNFTSFYNNINIESCKNTLNNTLTTYSNYFPNLEQCTFSLEVRDSNYNFTIIQNNNTIGDNLPFIRLDAHVYSSSSYYEPAFITNSNNNSTGYCLLFNFNIDGTLSFINYRTSISNLSYNLSPLFNKIDNTDTANVWNFISFGNSTFYLKSNNNDTLSWVWNTNKIYNVEPQPEEPSGDNTISGTGTITNNSGDTTGKIDLSGIEQGIGNIQNQISGDSQRIIENQNQNTETIVNTISGEVVKITNTLTDNADSTIDNTKITSGDIENALGFEIAQDPYSNFWTTLTNNLKNALLGTKRSIDITFQGRTWTISLDEYMVLPTWLTIILIPFSTAFFTWVLVRQWKHIFDKLSSGNIDSILKENSEERYF